jgi:hypothetical protein
MTPIAVRPATRRGSALLNGTRVLLGLFGAFKLYGTAYFTFFATAEQGGDPQGLGDWAVAAWSTVLAVAFLVAAVRLGRDRRVIPALAVVLALDLVFSVVKLTVYDEPEAVAFMAVDLVILGLLARLRRKRAAAE